MKFDLTFFSSPTGQVTLVTVVALVAGLAIYSQRQRRPAALPAAPVTAVAPLPKTTVRDGARFRLPSVTELVTLPTSGETRPAEPIAAVAAPVTLPLSLVAPVMPTETAGPVAPFGRLVPCETVLAIESNRLETPVLALVTEDVWHHGRLVIPAGSEVHGRASTDRARERLAAEGTWTIVWRGGPDNGRELTVRGLALDRERDPVTGVWGAHDGSAGLRGTIVRTDDWREVQLFAATFLSAATAALQETRGVTGLLGETNLPAVTARNATLAGSGAVLRDYAQQIRESIDRDGFYVRVPAGKAFYLYLTETLDLGRSRPAAALTPHAN
ncbi:MAG: TrbI/VirB10 family protein [Candidatus Didemnitutus sp.]|nr:TrbI/VirB10 family protein [Candidatus Didemnitutus sp.]